MSHYDVNKIAERFKKPVDEVERKINEWKSKAKEVLKNDYQGKDLDDFIDSLVQSRLYDIFPMGGFEYIESQVTNGTITDITRINTIVVGISPIRDDNDFNKREITSKWWNATSDKEREELQESKEIELRISRNGNQYPVAIDMRETYNNGIENPNYGKEFPFKPYRYIPLIIDGALVMGKGNLANRDSLAKYHPRVGYKSIVYGRMYDKTFKINKDCYMDEGVLDNAWNFIEKPMRESELFMPIEDVHTLNPYKKFITNGNIWTINASNPDKISVTIGFPNIDRGIKLSTRYKPLIYDISNNLIKGQEVMVYGEKRTFKNDEGETIPYYDLWGIIGKKDDAKLEAIKMLQMSNL